MYQFSQKSQSEESEEEWTVRKKGTDTKIARKTDVFGDQQKEKEHKVSYKYLNGRFGMGNRAAAEMSSLSQISQYGNQSSGISAKSSGSSSPILNNNKGSIKANPKTFRTKTSLQLEQYRLIESQKKQQYLNSLQRQMELNKEEKKPEQEQEFILDLSKTVPISAEEELKLGAFLNKFQNSIKGDSEMEAIFGNTIQKWSNEIEIKQEPKKEQ